MFSVGNILRKEREKKRLTLKQVEKSIHIREKFLGFIEDNNWSQFSSKIYIEGIMRNYARFLGIEHSKILAFFRRDYERKEEVRFKKHISSEYLKPQTKKVITFLFILLFILFFGYFTYQLKIFLTPPSVTLVSPEKVVFRSVQKIAVKGKTEKEATITIFGDRVYQNKEGVFTYDFPLKKGKNEFVVEVVGANGKKSILRKVFTLE